MTDRLWTIWILIGIAVCLIGWDIYVVFFNKEKNDSISEVIRWWAKRPIVPFAFGVLCGHWFW